MNKFSQELYQIIINHTPELISAFGLFLGFYIAGFMIKKVINSLSLAKQLNPAIVRLLGRTAKNLLTLLGSITALGTLGVDVSAMVAGLGLTGFALGFALKDILSNLISGVLILLYEPFKLNDSIVVDKYEGKVVDINLRYTTISQAGNDVLVPNSFLFSKPISVNKS
jgi:small-conductance mechanosensitive channel